MAGYTSIMQSVQYDIKGLKPSIDDCIDKDEYLNILKAIDSYKGIEPEMIEFLKLASTRFIRFRYDKIAELYANSDAITQKAIERLALVIIDFEDAIEHGFIRLTERMRDEFDRAPVGK